MKGYIHSGVQRIYRRFLKSTYVAVWVCVCGESLLTSCERGIQKTLFPFVLAQSSCHNVVMCNMSTLSSIGMLPFIEGSLGDGTSGLVAVSREVALQVKSTLRVSLLKVAVASARMAVARMWLGDG